MKTYVMAIGLAVAGSAWANNGNGGGSNGQPFQDLQEAVARAEAAAAEAIAAEQAARISGDEALQSALATEAGAREAADAAEAAARAAADALETAERIAADQELTAEMLANRDAIQANAAAIEALGGRVTLLESHVDTLFFDLGDLQDSVEGNIVDIQSLLNTTAGLQGDLDSLAAQHAADMEAIDAAIDALETRVAQAELDLVELQVDLQRQVATHDLDVADLSASLAALDASVLAHISTATAQIASLQLELSSAQSELEQLKDAHAELEIQVDGLEIRTDALAGRIDTLEGSPLPEQCQTGNDSTYGTPWVVCDANPDEAWIAHAARSGGRFAATQVCQELGYDAVGAYGGTCGSICGYCQGQTSSCSSPGSRRFDGGGNVGSGPNGQVLAYTVHWTCVKN